MIDSDAVKLGNLLILKEILYFIFLTYFCDYNCLIFSSGKQRRYRSSKVHSLSSPAEFNLRLQICNCIFCRPALELIQLFKKHLFFPLEFELFEISSDDPSNSRSSLEPQDGKRGFTRSELTILFWRVKIAQTKAVSSWIITVDRYGPYLLYLLQTGPHFSELSSFIRQ